MTATSVKEAALIVNFLSYGRNGPQNRSFEEKRVPWLEKLIDAM
jgi:hypothetical protein